MTWASSSRASGTRETEASEPKYCREKAAHVQCAHTCTCRVCPENQSRVFQGLACDKTFCIFRKTPLSSLARRHGGRGSVATHPSLLLPPRVGRPRCMLGPTVMRRMELSPLSLQNRGAKCMLQKMKRGVPAPALSTYFLISLWRVIFLRYLLYFINSILSGLFLRFCRRRRERNTQKEVGGLGQSDDFGAR